MTKAIILNTRPAAQLQKTREAFEKKGFGVIDFPCIEITACDQKGDIIAEMQCINSNDVIIFTSQYAVKYAYETWPSWLIKDSSIVIAVGKKTAQVLEQYFAGNIWIPTLQNADGVIELLKGVKHFDAIRLMSAAGGRNVIQNFAIENNIELSQINVYKRRLPVVNDASLKRLEQTENILILASSATTINNLKCLLPQKLWDKIRTKKAICASTRIEKAARAIGFQITENMDTANPSLMAEKLACQYE